MKNKSIMAVVVIALIAIAGFGGYALGNQSVVQKLAVYR